MKIQIHAKLEFSFTLNSEQLRLLALLASLHYDSKCKGLNAIADGSRHNGLLTMWKNQVDFHERSSPDDEPILTASWGDLDTVLKATELAHMTLNGEELSEVERIRASFFGCMHQGNELRSVWVSTYASPKSPMHG